MKKFLKITLAIVKELAQVVTYSIENSLRPLSRLLVFILPYVMLIIGQKVFAERGRFGIGEELLVPLIIFALAHFLRSYSNKIGKGSTVPIPEKRFTEVSEDGEVSILNSRLQELILYVADLEDWLERKSLM